MIVTLVSVAVDIEVSVGCEIDCKAYNKRSKVGLKIIVIGRIAAEIRIEGGKVGSCIGLPSSLVTRGL